MQKLYANIIVDITQEKLDRTFQYEIPAEMQESLQLGMVVKVPFGRGNRFIKGYVVSISHKCEYDPSKMKEICEIVTDGSDSESRLIALAAWIRENYGATMIQALKTVIPIKQKVKPKEKKQICLIMERTEAEEKLEFYKKKHQKARERLLEALLEEEELPYELVTSKLNITGATIKSLTEQLIIEVKTTKVYRNPIKLGMKEDYLLLLNQEQAYIAKQIISEWEDKKAHTYLVHGITGSGKTEVYMELIAHAVKMGQQAIVLIPEIALTYQTVMRFYKRFGDRISIMNSRLSAGERYDQFERAKQGDIDVMIGPRSALFTPFPNLGIIIIDEEHEPTYKSESVPRYHAREVAIQRGILEGAKVVLGSATPSVDAYYKAKIGEYTLFTMQNRAKTSELPNVYVEDMRKEIQTGNRSVISSRLRELMQDRLDKRQQVMLFLNRRGYAGFISCRMCGHVIQCPHCDVSLSVHNNGKLVCHYCGYEESQPKKCPNCGSEFIRGFRVGTQQVEEFVQKEFPQAKILRMDMDTTKEKDGHEKILSAFSNQEADILIGTQMIVKGHDFPNVTLVGILAADLSLHASDYRAGERTFQLLTQAAGRAGRGEEKGEVIIQTYDPEHYCIITAANQDYESFYEQEIAYRSLAGYPPASNMMAIHGACQELMHLSLAMDYLQKFIVRIAGNTGVRIIGPADEPVAKVNDIYHKVIYLKEERHDLLTMIKDKVEQYIEANQGYESVNIQFDLN
ncbi:primosomal protein N' [uncultured Robinsoniella sp.]|uniref:replication restart helicase PriA n=1 Tax=uncultured Robinsoniella sp. TaxID=904190 RepID=UPI00374FDA2B